MANSSDPDRRLDNDERDFLLYRILDERIEFRDTFIRDLNGQQLIQSKVYFHKQLKYLNKISPENDAESYTEAMIFRGLWDHEKESEFRFLPRKIENLKLDYFLNFFMPVKKSKLLQEIKESFSRFNELNKIKNSLFYMSNEGQASQFMWKHVIKMMYNGSDESSAINYYNSHHINESEIRQIVRSAEWAQFWCGETNLFGKPYIDLTDYKKKLISWSKVYDNVRGGMECPADTIIDDNIAFDGWMINQTRKDRAQKANKQQLGNVKSGSSNVFIPAENREQAADIYSMNDAKGSRRVKKLLGGNKNG